MLRKLACAGLAALTLGAASLAATTPAEAYWRHHWHGGGWHHGGGGLGLALGLGVAGLALGTYPGWGYDPYYAPAPYYYGPPPPYLGYYNSEPACSLYRVRTHWGWRWRRECY